MDRIIEEKKSFLNAKTLISAAVIALIGIYWLVLPGFADEAQVSKKRLDLATVQQGEFEDFISIRGAAASASTVYLDTIAGGQVESVHVEDGAMVEQGQLLAKLSNASMQVNILANEARVTEQLNSIRRQELSLEQNRIGHERELIEIEYKIKQSQRIVERFTELVKRSVESRNILEDAKDSLEYLRALQKVALESQKSDLKMQENQLQQLKASAAQLEAGLELSRSNIKNLNIVAAISGKLTGFDVKIGQSFREGERIGVIEEPNNFKVTSMIDEYYLPRIFIGQNAKAKIDGVEYQLKVNKTYPNVQGGQAQIDLAFDGQVPTKLRSGQTIQLQLYLGDTSMAKIIPNGSFYSDTGGSWIFVVSENGENAHRRNVRLGRKNSQYIEVLDGLELNERVIVSDYSNFRNVEAIQLN